MATHDDKRARCLFLRQCLPDQQARAHTGTLRAVVMLKMTTQLSSGQKNGHLQKGHADWQSN
jgi:hypothetical protein